MIDMTFILFSLIIFVFIITFLIIYLTYIHFKNSQRSRIKNTEFDDFGYAIKKISERISKEEKETKDKIKKFNKDGVNI